MEIANFTGLELAREEPIFLPPVNIHIKDDSFFGTFKTECFTYIPLMNYADWIEDDAIKRKALNLYNRNYGIKEAIE